MPERPELSEVKSAWLNQGGEDAPVDIERLAGRRMGELLASTRSEIAGSIVAALFFAGVMALRFGPEGNRLALWGSALVSIWAIGTLFLFRRAFRREKHGFAQPGIEHYRDELRRRRDHLRSAWIWHGPLALACLVSAVALSGRMVPRRIWEALPLLLALVAWAGFGIRRRFRQAAELQREIDRKEETL